MDYTEKEFNEAVKQLYYWQFSAAAGEYADNFSAILFCMFQKADMNNLRKLTRGFPEYRAAWDEWNNTPEQNTFFAKYGHKPYASEGEVQFKEIQDNNWPMDRTGVDDGPGDEI